MTQQEARDLLNSYCFDQVPNETAAIKELMLYDLGEFDGLQARPETSANISAHLTLTAIINNN